MSDPNSPSGDNPAGGPPPPQNPYGQPSGQDPYGQPPASAPNYGQPPSYGEQPPAYGTQPQPAYGGAPAYAGGGDPDKRPGTVTAAGVITMICAGLSTLLFGFFLVALLVARDEIMDEIESNPDFDTAGISGDSAFGAIAAILGVFALWSLIAFILGLLVMRRSNAARITLVISAAMTAVFSLLGIGSGIAVVTLIAAIAVVVLLFTGGAGDWFKRKNAAAQY